MDIFKLTGQNLGQVFNSRLGRACICRGIAYITKRPNLKLKTRPKQLLGSLPLAFTLPDLDQLHPNAYPQKLGNFLNYDI